MKNFKRLLASLFCAALFFPLLTAAQINDRSSDWIRAESDNGEISVEFPAAYDCYGDQTGFSVSDGAQTYSLTEMRMLNVYHEKTLLSLEVYKTNSSKDAAKIFAERESRNGKKIELKHGKAKFVQVLLENERFYAARRYFTSENYLYILTAASRDRETPAFKRFFDSVRFKTSKAEIEPVQATATAKTVLFSALKTSQLEVEQNPQPLDKPADSPTPPVKSLNDEKSALLLIVFKPAPSYTEAARQSKETGSIRVRLTFSENGSVTKIGFINGLKDGLVRQAIFAAIRIKFLPAEKDGAAASSVKVVEYSFSIY